jgi:peptide chain release factor 3
MTALPDPIQRRRTFAIISHPDAGKTTLTEKLLLFGGAIQLAGEVKAKANRRQTRSDWMATERERGISIVTSVMTFEYGGHVFNLLDTPGHEDFSEDTYRTLSAVDSAVMVIDAAKGIEARTKKLFEICRLRDIPIVTFINKMDRESRDPFEILDEIEKTLALDTAPLNWPVGRGRSFAGVYDFSDDTVHRLEEGAPLKGPDSVRQLLPEHEGQATADEIALAREACRPFDLASFREGHLSPVMFGSALRNFGVKELIDTLVRVAPPPTPQKADKRTVEPQEPALTGFVFKIQANMDPNHRDRIAFLRVVSGKLARGMRVKQVRTGKSMGLSAPQFFFAQNRTVADEAWPGDIVGLPNHGTLRIGDTLTEGEAIAFHGVPSFAPEILRRVRVEDAMKAKKLKEAMRQMAEEGVVQVFLPLDGSQPIVGVVGALQLDVLRDRMAAEYNLPIAFDVPRFQQCRWVLGSRQAVEDFTAKHRGAMAEDLDGALVFMAESAFMLNYEKERSPDVTFSDIKDYQRELAARCCYRMGQPEGRNPRSRNNRWVTSFALTHPTAPRRGLRRNALQQRLARHPEDLAAALLGLDPEEVESGIFRLQQFAAGADLAEHGAALVEMVRRPGEDAPDDVEPVLAAGQRQFRLVPVFRRQHRHLGGVDIGRVGENQVVAAARHRLPQVALQEGHAFLQPMLGDVDPGNRESVGGEFDGVDGGIGEDPGGQDRQRARAGAEVEHALDLLRLLDQGEIVAADEVGEEDLADEGARHDHALVDGEGDALNIGAAGQIDGRLAALDPLVDDGGEPGPFRPGEPGVQPGVELVDGQTQRLQDQEGRLVQRRRRAMAIGQFRRVEAAHRMAEEIADGEQFVAGSAAVGLGHGSNP